MDTYTDKRKIENILLDLVDNIYGQFLLIFVPRHNLWMLPGGHLETGETMVDAVNREINEEVQLKKISTVRRKKLFFEHEDLEEDGRHKIFRVFRSRYTRDDFDSVALPQKEEGIEKLGWFSLKEIEKMPVSKMVSLVIAKVKEGMAEIDLNDRWQKISQECRERLQVMTIKLESFLRDVKPDEPFFQKINHEVKKASQRIEKIGNNINVIDNLLEEQNLLKEREKRKAPLVVIVYNQIEILETLQEFLEKEGYKVISFDDAEEALISIRDLHENSFTKISAAIIDIDMSERRGLKLELEIKSLDSTIKTILVSSFHKDSYENYLEKPISLDLLLDKLPKKTN